MLYKYNIYYLVTVKRKYELNCIILSHDLQLSHISRIRNNVHLPMAIRAQGDSIINGI